MKTMKTHAFPTVRVAGLAFAGITERQATDHIVERAAAGAGGWVVTPNLDIARQCAQRGELAKLVARADLVVADGMPLVWASRLQGSGLPARVAGSNLVESVSAASARRGLKVFLLGGADGVAQRAEAALRARYPGLRIVGTYCPPFGFEKDPQEYSRMRAALQESAPDVVFVGLGFPKQEHLIQALRPVRPTAWWLGIGMSLGFSAGEARRAPGWMQRTGLEWLHRLWQEPGRLAGRYLVHGIPFGLRVLGAALLQRRRGRAA